MQHSTEQLELIIASARDVAIILLDTEQCVTLWNAGAEQLLGWQADEIIGHSAERFFTPEDRAAGILEQEVRRAREEGRAENERWHVRKDGSRFWASGLAQPVYDENQTLQGYTQIFRDMTARRQAEERLRESQARLQLALDASALGTFVWYVQEDYTEADAQMLALFGLPPEGILSLQEALTTLIHPDDRSRYAESVAQAIDPAGPGRHKAEIRVMHANGTERWLAVTGQTVFGDDPLRPLHMHGNAADITERKRREAHLTFLADLHNVLISYSSVEDIQKIAGKRIAEYLQLSHCLFVEIDQEKEIAEVIHDQNADGFPSLVGSYRLGEFHTEAERRTLASGQNILIPNVRDDERTPEAAERFEALGIRSLANAPYIREGQWKFVLSAQHVRPYAWRTDEADLLRELAERIYLRIERARAEAALYRSETHLRALADNIMQLTWMADAEGWIFWYNRRWYDFTGTTLEEMQGWGWKSVHHPDYIEPVTRKWREHLRAGQQWEDTFPLRSHDGRWRWFLSRAFPIRDEFGNVTLWCGTNTDITEQRETEEALRRNQTEIEILNARLQRAMQETHHRVKNNLQVIAALVEMQDYGDSSVGEMAMRRINTHVRALATIHDLLTQQAKGDAEMNDLDAQAMLSRLIPMLQSMAEGRRIRYEAESVSLPIQQSATLALLVNELVSNAIKHGTGEIRITLRRDGRRARLEVCDDGPGFPVGFDPRQAANNGLELIDSAARWDLRGEVSYQNRTEGGARVVISFPIVTRDTG